MPPGLWWYQVHQPMVVQHQLEAPVLPTSGHLPDPEHVRAPDVVIVAAGRLVLIILVALAQAQLDIVVGEAEPMVIEGGLEGVAEAAVRVLGELETARLLLLVVVEAKRKGGVGHQPPLLIHHLGGVQ